nr:23S rRNA (uracil(1939)-C(5))-methyltransferase RlmD [Pseudomaricurvus alkylphenolicus]
MFKPGAGRRPSSESTPHTLRVEDFAQDGRGVARHEGKAVFIRGGIPGETVEVSHYRRQKRFSECEVRRVLDASDDRAEPFCHHYGKCGGCQLQHMRAECQPGYKQQALLSQLQRQQKISPTNILEPVVSTPQGYRARVRLGVDRNHHLAFREQGSDRLVDIEHCPVLSPSLSTLLPKLQAWLLALPQKHGVTHIELLSAEPSPAVVVRHIRPLSCELRERLQEQIAEANCFWQGDRDGKLTDLRGAPVEALLAYTLDGLTLAFEPGDFTQVNPAVNGEMVAQALQWLALEPNDRVMDLFCGIGNFTLPIARSGCQVTGVEAVEAMVTRARHNAHINGLENAEFLALDLEGQSLRKRLSSKAINKLLLDPPRAGAAKVCEQIGQSAVERLIYVSCNPASFVRDAGTLVRSGFELSQLRVLDMFPHTAHVETMALFVRTNGI